MCRFTLDDPMNHSLYPIYGPGREGHEASLLWRLQTRNALASPVAEEEIPIERQRIRWP
jgi:hypothetical protein